MPVPVSLTRIIVIHISDSLFVSIIIQFSNSFIHKMTTRDFFCVCLLLILTWFFSHYYFKFQRNVKWSIDWLILLMIDSRIHWEKLFFAFIWFMSGDKEKPFGLNREGLFTREVLLKWKHWNLMLELLQDSFLLFYSFSVPFCFILRFLSSKIFFFLEGLDREILMILAHSDGLCMAQWEQHCSANVLTWYPFIRFTTMHAPKCTWNEGSLLTAILIHILCQRASIQFNFILFVDDVFM